MPMIPAVLRRCTLLGALGGLLAAVEVPDTCYLFAFFRDNGQDGLHLAWSADGIAWSPLKGNTSFLAPLIGDRIMRDPCIIQGPDGLFRMVWTNAWWGRSIGYASSPDLITWSPQISVSVMDQIPTAKNCWAPEILWDAKRQRYLIFWATTIPGRFPDTEKSGDHNHRIYATTTADFATWEPTRLFFDPGCNAIDATIVPANGRFQLVYKDETKLPKAHKNLHLAVSDDVEGPYTAVPDPITPPESWVEGPTVLTLTGSAIVYFDRYTKGRYGALRTRDWTSWEEVPDLALPKGTRHGTVLTVSGAVVRRLLAVAP